MGKFTDNLFKKNRTKPNREKHNVSNTSADEVGVLVTGGPDKQDPTERLVSVAIERDGEVHKGFTSHSKLRRSLGDENPYEHTHGDIEGFWTSENRFLDRREANQVGHLAGQCALLTRQFLSSDVNDW